MKTYDTYENPEDMVNCKKKPIIISCKQMSEEFRVKSLEGDYAQGKPGDFLMKGILGELYICDREVFEKSYEILD